MASKIAGLARAAATIVSALLSASCATAPTANVTHAWSDSCYDSFGHDVDLLALPETRDCGFLPLTASRSDRRATVDCVASEDAAGHPFKSGYGSIGTDSSYCVAVLRERDGVYWKLFFDADATGQFGRGGAHSTFSVERCSTLALAPGTIGPGSFLRLDGCLRSDDRIRQIIASWGEQSR